MRDLRPAIGVALGASMAMILLCGAIVETTREVYMLFGGFVGGLVTACIVDELSRRRARVQPTAVARRSRAAVAAGADLPALPS